MKNRLRLFLCMTMMGSFLACNTITSNAATVIGGSYVKADNENNPIVTQNYGADPGVMVYSDTVYVYATNDSQELAGNNENTYSKITTLNCYSSKDMVNWTDHGQVAVAGRNGAAKWAGNSWAPCITSKRINGKDKFFLYFANNASSIGVLTADSPTGPWRDPIGHALITKQTAGCRNVEWLFDPAVLVDSDGTGYLYFGGGVPGGQFANPKTARVIRLGNDMTSTVGTAATIDAPYLFEDSGINKIGNTYYYSYCSNWNCKNGFSNAAIEYMTSNSPMGPFRYAGEVMKNPGVFFQGSTGNNHHSIFEFKGSYYMAYHTRTVESRLIGKSLGYRTTQIDKLNVSNGKINSLRPGLAGVSQLSYVNPYATVQAETIFTQAGIRVSGNGEGYAVVTDINNGDFTKVKGVNFSKGLKTITAKVRTNGNGTIEVHDQNQSGAIIGKIAVSNTNGSFKDFTGTMNNVSGVKNICFVFRGNMEFDSWIAGTSSNTPAPAPAPTDSETVHIEDGWYYLKNTLSQKYLTVEGNKANGWTNVCISTGTGVDGQKWYVTNTSDGYITLTSKLGSFMLDVANGADEDGANIGIYNGYSGDAQKFVVKKTTNNGIYTIVTKASSLAKALDVYNHAKTDGTNVCQWKLYGNPNQQWQFEKVNSGSKSKNSANMKTEDATKNSSVSAASAETDNSSSKDSSSKSESNSESSEDADEKASDSLDLSQTINSWGSGYNVSFKLSNNTGKDVNDWTIRIKKSDLNISSSWNVTVKEDGDSYVLTPASWNSNIANGASVEFGVQGEGTVESSIPYEVN